MFFSIKTYPFFRERRDFFWLVVFIYKKGIFGRLPYLDEIDTPETAPMHTVIRNTELLEIKPFGQQKKLIAGAN